ncbi:MAG: capsule biosynthesis protein [Pseudomonadales bacterium]|nr:capsule biosynthesis protein [Pseudomonadales bacterium]
MKVGFVNIFSFRPHVEHLYYLSKLFENAGHDVFFLTCDSSVSNCYARQIKGTGRITECSKCMIGGVRSFTGHNVSSIKRQASDLPDEVLEKIVLSSSCTATRTESEAEWGDPELVSIRESLKGPAASVYESTRQWIDHNQLEAVICFNGRMDLTRAVTSACENVGIPYLTHERTWFGDGIQLVPNANCLSLLSLRELVKEYDNQPLLPQQARSAGKLIGERFLQRNSLEWRLYNKNPEPAPWPVTGEGKRFLIVPSSKNEFAGHDEWMTGWEDNTKALDDFFDVFNVRPEQVVLRCHPNWAENIGQAQGNRSLSLYRRWAKERGIHLISSEEKASTYDLIQQADTVIMNGGSSSVEAGACGKQVVCLGPSTYDSAGFVQVFNSRADMEAHGLVDLDPNEVRRKTLRFLYVRSHRFPQFVDYVKAIETTRYRYFQGADVEQAISMLKTGKIPADDSSCATNPDGEDETLDLLVNKQWSELADYVPSVRSLEPMEIGRRTGFGWVDGVRSLFSRGDR